MPDGGILLALPAQSIAVRLVLAALIAIAVVRLLLRADVRNAGVRVAYALLPIGVLLAVVVASLADLRLPTLMVPAADAPSQVIVGLGGDYLYLAPLTLPAIMGAWALVAAIRILLRSVRTARAARTARMLMRDGSAPATLRRRVLVLARTLGITPPPVVVGDCPGGAAAIGIRKPVLVLDADFVASLDDDELDGVIAHELAHVARRDNLVAYLFGLGRDVTFFLPGGNWALRQLLVERELAADQTAISATRRPGALAGGLLKVLEASESREACAALMPTGTLAARVATLCEDQPRPRPLRTSAETLSVVAAFVGLVATSMLVPRWIAGPDPEAGVGVMLAAPTRVVDSAPARPVVEPDWDPDAVPQALGSYHETVDSAPIAVGGDLRSPDEQSDSLAAGMLRTCAGEATCRLEPRPASTLELHPRPVLVQRDFPVRWHAQPVGTVDDGAVVRFYYLSSLPN